MTIVTFRKGDAVTVIEVDRDPFEVCELARQRIFPDEKLEADLVFQQIMQDRKRAGENRSR